MPTHSLDLHLSPQHDAAIRSRWEALRAAGLPSLADHKGASNAPHVTVVSAPSIPGEVLDEARTHFTAALPLPLTLNGLLVLGRGPFVLAEHVLVPPELRGMVEQWQQLADADPARLREWTPHITLAKRLSAPQVGQALDVLREHPAPESARAEALIRWDPHRKVTVREA